MGRDFKKRERNHKWLIQLCVGWGGRSQQKSNDKGLIFTLSWRLWERGEGKWGSDSFGFSFLNHHSDGSVKDGLELAWKILIEAGRWASESGSEMKRGLELWDILGGKINITWWVTKLEELRTFLGWMIGWMVALILRKKTAEGKAGVERKKYMCVYPWKLMIFIYWAIFSAPSYLVYTYSSI